MAFWIWDAAQNASFARLGFAGLVLVAMSGVLTGVLVLRPGRSRPMTRRTALVAGVVFLVTLLGVPARATLNAQTTADEPHYLLTALSLWEDHSLDYGDERAEVRYWPFHSAILLVQAELQDDGSRVAPHDPLLPLVLAAPDGPRPVGWRPR